MEECEVKELFSKEDNSYSTLDNLNEQLAQLIPYSQLDMPSEIQKMNL